MRDYTFVLNGFKLNSMEIKNRMVMSPMGTQFATDGGDVTDRMIRYYQERAKGGVSLIITEHVGISDEDRATKHMLMLSRDSHKEGMRRLAGAIHQAGGKLAVQLNYPGKNKTPADFAVGELKKIAGMFADAAVRAKESNVDAVELHMANGYLLHRFLSPVSNNRSDKFSGDDMGRVRFPEMVLREVRCAVGKDFPVWCRIAYTEDLKDGIEIENAKYTAKIMEKSGADAIHVTAGSQLSLYRVHPSYYHADAANMDGAAEIKRAVKIPVIAGGKIRSLDMAEDCISAEKCDLVSFGRPLIADPYFIQKSVDGEDELIVKCLSCCSCVKAYREGGLRCTLNPSVGKDFNIIQECNKKDKRILVIGGGIAGIEAAIECAEQGCKVILAEKKGCIGGNVLSAMIPPGKELLGDFLQLMKKRLLKAGVELRLNTKVTLENAAQWNTDIVIVATGSVPKIPRIPGIENIDNAMTFKEILSLKKTDKDKIGRKILILGGGVVGAEMADYLGKQMKEVTIVEMREEIAFDAVIHLKHDLLERLKKYGVRILTGTKVIGFTKDGVRVEQAGCEKMLSGYDNVVLAMGLTPDCEMLNETLQDKAEKVLCIGDAVRPRQIIDAMEEGYVCIRKIREDEAWS
ncbi:MAG: NAD(P)/FAD-dependent oxidoreductase [Clostridium sp.]|nr:NAD(P)/FAD-dependent oxidoreductase [Clostridium sp.]